MKFRLTATIPIYFLLTLLFSTLYVHASQEKKEETTKPHIPQNYSTQTDENRAKILLQKWTVFSRLLNGKHKLPILEQFLLGNKNRSKNSILFLILNQFLTCKDVLNIQKTCRFFQNLLHPNRSNMVTFCNYADSQKMTETTIIWEDLKYLQSYYSAFDRMEMFNIKKNQYAVLTCVPEKQIIVWNNSVIPYPQILLHQATLLTNHASSNNFVPFKTFNKCRNAWALITKEGNVKTGGDKQDGGNSCNIQPRLHNVKMIFSTLRAFAALLNDSRVVAWGNENYEGKIPDNIQPRLQNVKMIFSTFGAFAALLNDSRVVTWANENYGGKIPDDIHARLQNVKTIFFAAYAFAAVSIIE